MRQNKRQGLTLIEMLVATLIMLIAILGMVGTWASMMRTTLTADNQGAAYEVAKQVMERTRSVGFFQVVPAVNATQTLPNGTTKPNPAKQGYDSPLLARWRFFNINGQEINYADKLDATNIATISDAQPLPPSPDAIFCAKTEIAWTTAAAGRPDLQMLVIQVTVYNARVVNGPMLYQMQDALTTGGV